MRRNAILVLAAAGLITYSSLRHVQDVSADSSFTPDIVAKDPVDWFVDVKRDGKAARIAAAKGNRDVLIAVAGSALAYRREISAWTRSPVDQYVTSFCGDLVIALARVAEAPEAALTAYARLEDRCRDAIIPPVR